MTLMDYRVSRLRHVHGTYLAEQWPRFLHDHGMIYLETDQPIPFECYRYMNTIVYKAGISKHNRAFLVWHEIAHGMLHAGEQHWWLSRPQGTITVGKFEWQADVLAALFPVWERGVLDEVLRYYGVKLPVSTRSLWRR